MRGGLRYLAPLTFAVGYHVHTRHHATYLPHAYEMLYLSYLPCLALFGVRFRFVVQSLQTLFPFIFFLSVCVKQLVHTHQLFARRYKYRASSIRVFVDSAAYPRDEYSNHLNNAFLNSKAQPIC